MMRDYPQHEDLGLDPAADKTPDLRPGKSDDLGAGTPRPSEPTLTRNQIGDSIMSHDNPYPVDSATRHCCGGIGSHTAECDINLPDPDVPLPAGATTDGWLSVDTDGAPIRSLEWSRHDTDKVGVGVDGFQDATGEVTRSINLYLRGQDLDADDARALAAKLVEAADELDRLPEL
jgi:hypothetical protein